MQGRKQDREVTSGAEANKHWIGKLCPKLIQLKQEDVGLFAKGPPLRRLSWCARLI